MRPERQTAYANLQIPVILAVALLSVLGCTVRPSPHRRLLYLPIILLVFFFIFCIRTEDLLTDYSQSMWISTNLFVMSDFLLLTDVQRELRKKGQHASISSASFSKRLYWGFDLYTSARGVGWQHDVTTHLPPAATKQTANVLALESRLQFVLRQLLALGQCGLLFAIAHVAIEMNTSFRASGPPFNEQVWWLQPTVFGHALAGRAALDAAYILCSIMTVSLGIFPVDAWPPLFGSVLEAYSVHNLWRRVWHQMMRRFLTVHMNHVDGLLKPRSKLVRSLIKLYTAFLISAFVHYMGDIAILGDWSCPAVKFFALQALAVTFEILVTSIVRKSGIRFPRWAARVVGYIWVAAWFIHTIPVWIQPIVRTGLIDDGWHSPVIVGIAEGLKVHLGIETG